MPEVPITHRRTVYALHRNHVSAKSKSMLASAGRR